MSIARPHIYLFCDSPVLREELAEMLARHGCGVCAIEPREAVPAACLAAGVMVLATAPQTLRRRGMAAWLRGASRRHRCLVMGNDNDARLVAQAIGVPRAAVQAVAGPAGMAAMAGVVA